MKSQINGILLTLFFGPLGNLYGSVSAGVIMIVVCLALISMTAGLSLVITWPLCILVSIGTVADHNTAFKKAAALEESRHQELLEAARHGAA